ncbi:hypothetical protein BDV39DRAFT_163916 [Aspergillus sergii]|uniref:Uncharacterized protein n=1 Tax=Aspergillus sergii TaxID=1034303 RepID=A0A5N6WPU6_9EURO|nr:hypothetical protein BDV39DRAFT_163916 [Aspergillus sergii]
MRVLVSFCLLFPPAGRTPCIDIIPLLLFFFFLFSLCLPSIVDILSSTSFFFSPCSTSDNIVV